DVEDAVNAADSVYLEFRNTSVEYRQNLLNDIVKEYENRKEDLIKAMTLELGTPVTASENVHYEMGLSHFKAARDALDNFNFRERRGNN
ncbi:aldehyde dehydrogenase family protein, partial [Staphylococcus aureus]|nr:aldehyde dehydrogenase family protein [Staphylococcus aureus]